MRVRRAASLSLVVSLALALAACGDDDGGDNETTTTAADAETTTTISESTTTTAEEETTTTDGAGTLQPGDPCSLEEGEPDCIDPDGDGEGTYLIGGADCMAALPDAPELCTDLDGDGVAGYPDSG